MGLKTKIEYLVKNGSTHNFWSGGCNPISEGCRNCFAKRIYERFYGKDFSVPIKSKNFDAPLKWKKPRVILVNDMSDFFHKDVPFKWRMEAVLEMAMAKQHIFLLLTKRPENIHFLFNVFFRKSTEDQDFKNIWLGVSVENQKTADERIPELLKIPHFKKWVSVEPMLESINIIDKISEKHFYSIHNAYDILPKINWLICGSETGQGARHMNPEWAKYLLYQCKSASVPFFMKQMSGKEPIPKDLMVREYPLEIESIVKGG